MLLPISVLKIEYLFAGASVVSLDLNSLPWWYLEICHWSSVESLLQRCFYSWECPLHSITTYCLLLEMQFDWLRSRSVRVYKCSHFRNVIHGVVQALAVNMDWVISGPFFSVCNLLWPYSLIQTSDTYRMAWKFCGFWFLRFFPQSAKKNSRKKLFPTKICYAKIYSTTEIIKITI